MSRTHVVQFGQRLVVGLALAALTVATLAGCGSSAGANGSLRPVTVGLTYIPNIQFAPFYVADSLGYFKDAGVQVTLHHHAVADDEFGALVSGKENVIFAGGDETLQARSHNIPLVYVAQVYNTYPIALIVPASSSIHTAADLRGHSIGIPGKYGANYIGLLALLKSAGLQQSDVTIQSLGYTQVPSLLAHHVDAVVGYLNNEPVQFQKAGFPIRTLLVSNVQPLVSDGVAALQSELDNHPSDVKAVVAATLRGVQYTIAHPQEAVNISKKYVPGLDQSNNAADALAVLQTTIPLWQGNGKLGYNDPGAWTSMESFLQAQGQLAGPVDASKSFSNAYLPS